jgi:hypothetical protein
MSDPVIPAPGDAPKAREPMPPHDPVTRPTSELQHALHQLADWFETVNQKFTNTTDGQPPPSYAELFEDAQNGVRLVGYLLEITHE